MAIVLSQFFISATTKKPYKTLLCHVLIFVFTYFFYDKFSLLFNTTYDGNSYHRPAITLLINGWNPLFEPLGQNIQHDWIKYFPKAPWIIQACLITTFAKFGWGAKVLNLLFGVCAGLFSYQTFCKLKISKSPAILILLSLCAILTPVFTLQLKTFMVDGILFCEIVILISILISLFKEKTFLNYSLYFMILCLLLNTKLSAIATFGVILLFYLIHLKNKKDIIKFCKISLIFTLIGLFFVGFNPYSTNLIHKHNPFYPIGSKVLNITKTPKVLENKTRVERLFLSIFSKVHNIQDEEKFELKLPFLIYKEEIFNLMHDTRVSGFGVLFGLAFLISNLALFFLKKEEEFKNLILFLLCLIATALINPECYWARFIPQLSLYPLSVCAFAIKNNRKIIATTLFIIIILNQTLIIF